MIRFRRLDIRCLSAWLLEEENVSEALNENYKLRLWRENPEAFDHIREELVEYVEEAHEDTRARLRDGFQDYLSPYEAEEEIDPAANYPGVLNIKTLKGYFGETLAGLVAEHWGAQGQTDWKVPAFLFRFHNVELEHLEAINQRLALGENIESDENGEIRPGRTGDDALAFRMNENGVITEILCLEAKCLKEHQAGILANAHKKLASEVALTGIRELINLLEDYDTQEANQWSGALVMLRAEIMQGRGGIRHDGVLYACEQVPKRRGHLTWMPSDQAHPEYTAERTLDGFEIHFQDIDELINAVYRRNLDD